MIKFYYNAITGLEYWIISKPVILKSKKQRKINKK